MIFGDKATKIEHSVQKGHSAKLIPLLKDKNLDVRIKAIQGLGKIGDDHAINALIGLLSDPNQTVRMETIKSMGDTGNQTVRSHLQHLIQTETDDNVKKVIREAIARIPAKDYSSKKIDVLESDL